MFGPGPGFPCSLDGQGVGGRNGGCRCEGALLVDSEAEQVQKCSAAAQGIFSRVERLCGCDFERVLAICSDRDRHFALGKIGRRVHCAENIAVRFGDNQLPLLAFNSELTKNVERPQIDGGIGERRAHDEFVHAAAHSHGRLAGLKF